MIYNRVPQASDNLRQLIHAWHSGDWEGYLTALECLIKYLFAQFPQLHLANANPPCTDERTLLFVCSAMFLS